MVNQLTDGQIAAARAEVRDWMKTRPDVTAAHIAQYTTLSDSAVRCWIAGGMRGGCDVVDQIVAAVRKAKQGEILQPGGGNSVALTEDQTARIRRVRRVGTFYATQTVQRVAQVLDWCAEHCAIGVVTADFGVGKTEAVREWRRQTAGRIPSTAFEFDEFSSTNKIDFVKQLAAIHGLDTNVGSANGGMVFRALCEALRRDPSLLIFDQCETLRPRIVQIIRQIHDRTCDAGVGVCLLAAPVLLQRLIQNRGGDLGALTSRVGIWAPLAGITKHEMAAILKQEGLADVDAAAFDAWYHAVGGSMRRLMRSLELIKSKHAGKTITEKTIAGVAGNLWGMSLREVAA